MDQVRIILKSDHPKGTIEISGSKSISNRLLIMNQLAGSSKIQLNNLSTADDTSRLQQCLIDIENCSSSRIPLVIDAGNAGTVFRFLTAYLSLKKGKFLLTGNDRMKKRPIGDLVAALKSLGAEISYKERKNFPPLMISGKELSGNNCEVDASKSSQFVTALMMIAPYLEHGLTIRFSQKPVSFEYIKMTARLMMQHGIEVDLRNNAVSIEAGGYNLNEIYIEPDWSSASYWYEVAAISEDAELFLPGFRKDSVQGDQICARLYEQFGVMTTFTDDGIILQKSGKNVASFEYDFTNYPDLVPAIAATCSALQIPGIFHGVGHLKYKESDRIASLSMELSKIGAKPDVKNGSFHLIPSQSKISLQNITFDTYNDHRIAMCLAPLVLKLKSISINNPEVVAKSYPHFWEDLKKCGIIN